MPHTDQPRRRDLLALATISATLLAYQIWLTRVIAVQHWYHLAPLIIALAMLGFGIAGVVVALQAGRIRQRHQIWLRNAALLTGVCLVAGLIAADQLPLNMLALPWQLHQVALLALYGSCFLPAFLCSALFISVCFVRWPQSAGRIYAVDLLGGALGAIGILLLIDLFGLLSTLWLLVLLPLLVTFMLCGRGAGQITTCTLATLLAMAGLLVAQITPAEYKAASQRLLERGSHTLLQIDGLSQRLTVLETPGLHSAPGLSLSSPYSAPAQWQLFSNADEPVPLLLPPLPDSDFYSQLLGYAPYLLLKSRQRALYLNTDTLWQAWIGAAEGIEEQQLTCSDQDTIDLLENLKKQQPQGIYPQGVQLHPIAARRYLATAGPGFDLITLSVASPEAGMAATQENYLLTTDGLNSALERLGSQGILVVELQLHSVPRELLKLVATVAELLQRKGQPAARHLAIVRDWRSAVVMVSRSAIDREAQARLRLWTNQNQFDLVALPGLLAAEANRYHRLSEGYFSPLQRLLQDQHSADEGLFYLQPATDDKPFFFRFTRWQSLLDWLRQAHSGWRAHLDWGYLLSVATLLSGCLLAILLLAIPVLLTAGDVTSGCQPPRWTKLYFAAIGFGFMFVEIGLLQQATLLLDATAVSMAAVIVAMLTGAGCGSLLQNRLQPGTKVMRGLLLSVALLTLCVTPLLHSLLGVAADWSLIWRLALVVLPLIAISLPMGLALPHAISRLSDASPATIAWAWALNGFSSVIGALGAGLIAVHWGFSTLMLTACGCYLLAGASLRSE